MGIARKEKKCKNCGLDKFLFGHGLCKFCYGAKFKKPIKSNKRINKKSPSFLKRHNKYMLLRNLFLEEFKICQACNSSESTEVHHKAGRDGDNLFKDFLAVCRSCHDKIENNPIWAKEQGYSISRLN